MLGAYQECWFATMEFVTWWRGLMGFLMICSHMYLCDLAQSCDDVTMSRLNWKPSLQGLSINLATTFICSNLSWKRCGIISDSLVQPGEKLSPFTDHFENWCESRRAASLYMWVHSAGTRNSPWKSGASKTLYWMFFNIAYKSRHNFYRKRNNLKTKTILPIIMKKF